MIRIRVVAHCDTGDCARQTIAVAEPRSDRFYFGWTALQFPDEPDGTPSGWYFDPKMDLVLCPDHAKEGAFK